MNSITGKTFLKVSLYCLPLVAFFVMVFIQTSYHFLRYQKDKNAYILKGNLLELSSKELNKFYIYLDPTGKYFFKNEFIDLLINNDKELITFLQNIRFTKQDMFIFTEEFSVGMSTYERLSKSPIQIGINNDNTPKLCYKPDIFKMLFEFKEISAFELLGLAKRFARECNGYVSNSFDKNKLHENQLIDYYNNAYRAFIRESLNILKPIRVSAKLSFINFLQYVIISDFTMSSSDIEAKSQGVNSFKIIFAIFTYFLLTLQATVLGAAGEKKIAKSIKRISRRK